MVSTSIVAVFTPAPGKVRELLAIQAENTRKDEDYTLRFVVTEQINADTPEFCLFETFESDEAADRHVSEPYFVQFMKSLNEEKVLAKDPAIWRTKNVAGFDIDKKDVPSA